MISKVYANKRQTAGESVVWYACARLLWKQIIFAFVITNDNNHEWKSNKSRRTGKNVFLLRRTCRGYTLLDYSNTAEGISQTREERTHRIEREQESKMRRQIVTDKRRARQKRSVIKEHLLNRTWNQFWMHCGSNNVFWGHFRRRWRSRCRQAEAMSFYMVFNAFHRNKYARQRRYIRNHALSIMSKRM